MRERTIALLALAGILAFGAAWAQDTAALVQAIQGEDASARMAAVAELEEMGAPAIGPLFGLIGGDDGVADRLARRAAQAITQQAAGAGDEAQRAPVAAALIAQTTSDRCLGARHWALRMLSFVGGDGDVPALARLLQDDDVREMARYALVRIPGEASLAALSGAASVETDPAFKAALITSLGSRGDPAGLPVVREALKDRTRPVRAAAIDALARIPDPASEQALREALSGGRAEERQQACSAYLRLAETLLSAGHTEVAEQMYQRMYSDAPTEPARYAGLVGLARSQGSRAMPTLLAALDSHDAKIRATARTALVDTDGLTRAIGEVVVRPPSREVRLMLIGVLTARGDPAAIPALLQVAGIEDEETQIAAFEALGKLRRSAAATTLLLALDRSEQGPVRDAAVAALSKIPGSDTTQAIARMLATAPSPELRIALAQVLGRRPHPSARTALLAATTDADEAVQAAALEALGQCGDPAATPTLLAMLRMAEGDVRNAAESALEKMPAAESREAMVAALPGAPDDMRATLLRLLGRDPDGSLASTFTRAARDDDEAVAVAAIEAL
ncbi:MAG: HEAT repeat domain-containing protein, partial [Armatimonadota bacterium]